MCSTLFTVVVNTRPVMVMMRFSSPIEIAVQRPGNADNRDIDLGEDVRAIHWRKLRATLYDLSRLFRRTGWRCHELRADRIGNRFAHDFVNSSHCGCFQLPSNGTCYCGLRVSFLMNRFPHIELPSETTTRTP